jgi:hypothetical protein
MLDRPDQVERLMAAMEAALPIPVTCQPALLAQLRAQKGFDGITPKAAVTKLRYMDDEGGIVCSLDFGLGKGANLAVVSLTHVSIDPAHALAKDIASYQYHRIKALRAQAKGGR